MMLGGSTTSLLAFINGLDLEKFEVDLQLFENKGDFLKYIPEGVNLLPEAKKYKGRLSKLVKAFKYVFSGYYFKVARVKKKYNSRGWRVGIITDFRAKVLSIKSQKHYDYAIGYLEGWSDRYLAYCVNADKKYAWLHSTFANITDAPEAEKEWMQCVDKIVFVTDACRMAFSESVPSMESKAITVKNIIDSSIINKRAVDIAFSDTELDTFVKSDKTKIITVCRLDIKTKGLDRIINAAKVLKSEGCRFVWYILGDGGAGVDKILEMAEEAGVGDVVFAIGSRINPYPYVKNADIMCMPSRYEGKPMVITESMILGTPPVVTNYLSANEQIKNGEDGIIVENDDESIVEPLRNCIQNPRVIHEMHECLLNNEYGNRDYIFEIEKMLFKDEI